MAIICSLYKYLQNKDDDYIYIFIKKLYTELENLHSKKKDIDEEFYIDNLKDECLVKIKKRFIEIEDILNKLNITKVNNIVIIDIKTIFLKIE